MKYFPPLIFNFYMTLQDKISQLEFFLFLVTSSESVKICYIFKMNCFAVKWTELCKNKKADLHKLSFSKNNTLIAPKIKFVAQVEVMQSDKYIFKIKKY